MSLILAGDLGGTKTNLATFRWQDNRFERLREATYPTQEAESLEATVNDYLTGETEPITSAAIGVAGPVRGDHAEITNVDYPVSAPSLAKVINVEQVGLINDLVAMGWGVAAVDADKLVVLNDAPFIPRSNAALIAAGTGLGEALLVFNGKVWEPKPSEGGHTSFAPQDALEDNLLQFLREELGGHVSYERVLSGPGLFNIYRFMRETGRGEEPEAIRAALDAGEDASPLVSMLGLSGESALCEAALNLFARIYGEEAGNLALTVMAAGGVFLGGGIAPKILPALKGPAFMEGFLNKGRMRPLLEAMPVKVMLEPKAPILGAARYAALMLEG